MCCIHSLNDVARTKQMVLQILTIQLPGVIEGGVWINDSREFGFQPTLNKKEKFWLAFDAILHL